MQACQLSQIDLPPKQKFTTLLCDIYKCCSCVASDADFLPPGANKKCCLDKGMLGLASLSLDHTHLADSTCSVY